MHLRVKITGLCLLVPETEARTVYYVLIPRSGHFGGSHIHEHRATLSYKGVGIIRDLDCRDLDLSALTGDAGTADLSRLVDAGRLANNTVHSSLLQARPPAQVAARVKLPPATRAVPGDIVHWEVADHQCAQVGQPEMLTHHLEWIVENLASPVPPLTLEPLRHGCPASVSLPPPEPVGNEICLSIVNLPVSGRHTVQAGACAPHFRAYFRLVPSLVVGEPNLQLPALPGSASPVSQLQCPGAPPQIAEPDPAESAFNCMLAKADPG